ncbi:MAG: TldD/PmbA family protein [Synergistaceae bacterium]|nr:TldD/PmbA family protein [Synergistaceae bacterium]
MTGLYSSKEIELISEWMIEEVLRSGASGADVLYSEGAGSGISLKDGEIEECVTGSTSGIGVRTIMSDGRQGISYGNRLDRPSLKELVEWSLFNCRNAEPEEGIRLYDGKLISDPSIDLEDPDIAALTPQKRMEFCRIMSESAMSANSGKVLSVRSASWHDGWGSSFYCTSTGLNGWERGSSASCGVTVIASDGKNTEMGGHGLESRRLDELDIRKVALEAVDKTVRALGGRPIKTGPYTIVIEPETAVLLIDVIGDLFCAPEIHKGRSMMADRLGTKVASSCVTLIDDGRIPWKAGTGSWDAEGVPTGRTLLIEDGNARSYLYNLQYAFKDGVVSTGNACRGMSSLPDVGTSNLLLQAGSETPVSIISAVKSGFYLTEMMGLHTIDPVSGDFSVGAKGLLIENGVITSPVSGVTIASNLMDFLNNIVAVGSDLTFFGSTAAPTLVVENIVVAGE